jgi:hypothetical protein
VNPQFASHRAVGRVLTLAVLLVFSNAVAQDARESRFAQRVSQQNLLRTVRSLVSFGNRYGGSPSGDSAASWVAGRFERARLSAEIVEDEDMLTFHHRGWTVRAAEPRSLRNAITNAWLGGYSPSCDRTAARVLYVPDASVLG